MFKNTKFRLIGENSLETTKIQLSNLCKTISETI